MNTVVMPKMSDMMTEGKILGWNKKPGDAIKKGDSLGEVETEKVNIDIESFFSGTVLQLLANVGDSVPVGEPIALIGLPEELATIQQNGASQRAAASAATPAKTVEPQGQSVPIAMMAAAQVSTITAGGRLKASPLARRLAEEHAIDLTKIVGTGPEGRIIKDDVLAVAANGAATTQVAVTMGQGMAASDEKTIIPLTNIRRTIARRLQESAQTSPHFFVTMTMDATNLVSLRDQLNDELERQRVQLKLSFNDIIVMAVARALVHHPEINASFGGDHIVQYKSVHLGVAVALETGLIVPVLRDADKRGIIDLSREIRRLSEAARSGKLRPDEFNGGTFTISNLGMYGVDEFTAIINPPEAAILAVGAIVSTPVVEDGQIVAREQIKMTLSSDHRVIDGAQAAIFMRDLRQYIEAPTLMML